VRLVRYPNWEDIHARASLSLGWKKVVTKIMLGIRKNLVPLKYMR